MPRVVSVIPVRDRACFVREAIGSVVTQRYDDHALVVVDDGSGDETAAVAEEAVRGARVSATVLRRSHAGVAAARNAGVAVIDSAWIAFLDSDDLWLETKLVRQMAWIDAHPAYRIAQTEERWIDGGRHRNPRNWHRKEERLFPRCLERCLVSPSAVVIRRDLYEELGGFDESFRVCEDYELWLRVALDESVGLVSEQLVVKRGGHADQLSRSMWGLDRYRVAALVKLLSRSALEPVAREAVLHVIDTKCAVLAGGAARRGRHDEAERYRAVAIGARDLVAVAGSDSGRTLRMPVRAAVGARE